MIADKACAERGCACHDPRVDGEGVELVARNDVLEEVAREFDKMKVLGDTAASFAAYVRGMKK